MGFAECSTCHVRAFLLLSKMGQAFLFSMFVLFLRGISATPLDDYVNAPDPNYKYEEIADHFTGDGYKTYFLNMTSQKWLNESVSSLPVWTHHLVVTIPDTIVHPEHAFLYITGGNNPDSTPKVTSAEVLLMIQLAAETGTITGCLFQIPNQPIYFTEDPFKKRRTEDSLIAFTWWHFVNRPDQPEYLARLPMTKASVRGLDTLASFGAKKAGPVSKVDKFVVAGASKRGWTTWTVAAVDKRVVGIVPIVMDLLNINKNMHHFYRALGGWTFAFKDYFDLNITADLDAPSFAKLCDIVDPYAYLDRLTMPKMLICTGGDEFFNPDDSFYFWENLQGTKFIRTLPNAEHSCTGHFISIYFDIASFYTTILLEKPFPKWSWQVARNATGGSITMTTQEAPLTVKMWHATTLDGTRRDFRLLTGPDPKSPTPHPVLWFSTEVTKIDDHTWIAERSNPQMGWTAFFIQATFLGERSTVLEVTTQTNIIPDTFPVPDCHGAGCLGKLV